MFIGQTYHSLLCLILGFLLADDAAASARAVAAAAAAAAAGLGRADVAAALAACRVRAWCKLKACAGGGLVPDADVAVALPAPEGPKAVDANELAMDAVGAADMLVGCTAEEELPGNSELYAGKPPACAWRPVMPPTTAVGMLAVGAGTPPLTTPKVPGCDGRSAEARPCMGSTPD